MLDEKQSKYLITQLIKEEKIVKPEVDRRDFFLRKSIDALEVAKRLYQISQDKNDTLKSYTWIIASSYYSMFFAATSLLANFGKKLDVEEGIHKTTFHALVYYFQILDKKLQKHFLQEYKENYDSAEELMQTSEQKATEFLENFKSEQYKRKIFTYEMGHEAQENKARTSLERAKGFFLEVNKMINK